MNKRLVWNFEINDENILDFQTLPVEEPHLLRWEARYFWLKDSIITLRGLNDSFLDLSQYKIKNRQDIYYVLPDHEFNVKQRRLELLYKPLIEETNLCQGFGKKINLSTNTLLTTLPGSPAINAATMLDLIRTQGQQIFVEKIALIYKLSCTPTIKLELATLKIANETFFSTCIEGHSQLLVTLISNHLLNQQTSCDYIHFLKNHYSI